MGSQPTFLREACSKGRIKCIPAEKIFIRKLHEEHAGVGWLEVASRECNGGSECSADKWGHDGKNVDETCSAMIIPSSEVQDILEGGFKVDCCTASQEDEDRVLVLEIFT
jgi:hypothetical protein